MSHVFLFSHKLIHNWFVLLKGKKQQTKQPPYMYISLCSTPNIGVDFDLIIPGHFFCIEVVCKVSVVSIATQRDLFY